MISPSICQWTVDNHEVALTIVTKPQQRLQSYPSSYLNITMLEASTARQYLHLTIGGILNPPFAQNFREETSPPLISHVPLQTTKRKQSSTDSVSHTCRIPKGSKHINNLADRPTCSDTTIVTPQILPDSYNKNQSI